MFQQVINFLEANSWKYTTNNHTITFGIAGENGNFRCVADVIAEENRFIFFTIYPHAIPDNKRNAMAELITRLNFGRFLGNFEMNYDNGELRYRVSLYYGTLIPNEDIVKEMLFTSIVSMDVAFTAIHALIEQNISPNQAYQSIKG
jgi:hypothetical protein